MYNRAYPSSAFATVVGITTSDTNVTYNQHISNEPFFQRTLGMEAYQSSKVSELSNMLMISTPCSNPIPSPNLRRQSRAWLCIDTGLNGDTATTDKGQMSHLTVDDMEEEEEYSDNIRLAK